MTWGWSSVHHHRTDGFAALHEFEAIIDLLEFKLVGDQVVDVDLAIHIPVDDFRHIGPAARAAECRAFPFAAGDRLERPGGDFGARFSHADNDGLPPTTVAAFQRLAHDLGVADAFERVVGTAVGQFNDVIDNVFNL